MGTFRIEIQAVGGHGCQRDVKDGEVVKDKCDNESCPDCKARDLVFQLESIGCNIETAEIIHWPGEESEVRDDMTNGQRKGSF